MAGLDSGLDKIIEEIGAASEGVIKELLDKAQSEADEITKKAEKEAEETVRRITSEGEKQLTDAGNRAHSAAVLAKRQLLLSEKQTLIGAVMEKAKRTFTEMPDSEYFDTILKLVKKNALPQDGEIIFNAADKKRMPSNFVETLAGAVTGGKLKVSDETRDIDGGFVLSYGGIEQNCSIGALFDSNMELLQDKIQGLLFR